MLGPAQALTRSSGKAEILACCRPIDKIARPTRGDGRRGRFKLVESDSVLALAHPLDRQPDPASPTGKRLLRGPTIKVARLPRPQGSRITDALIEKWARRGLGRPAPANFKRWRERARAIQKEVTAIPFNDTRSRYDRDHDFWFATARSTSAAWRLDLPSADQRDAG